MVYRPPNTSITKFNDDIQVILGKIQKEKKFACLLGDFNIDTYAHNNSSLHTDAEEFCNILQTYNYKQLINRPTRYCKSSPSLLDNIYTNLPITIETCESGILLADISDHFPVFTVISQLSVLKEERYYTIKISVLVILISSRKKC